MKFLIAPDSFKDCLPSVDVAESLHEGLIKALPSSRVILCPMADGGEGTTDVLKYHLSAQWQSMSVKDPLGRSINSKYLTLNDGQTAVIELAKASGLELLKATERNPLMTHTFGTGELIRHALDERIDEIILAVGGSATVDGGTGLAAALGFRFIDASGNSFIPVGGSLSNIESINISSVHPRFHSTSWVIASDVQNRLNGPEGAAPVYGPQKGADSNAIEVLAKGLEHLSMILKEQTGFDPDAHPGTGAAGGTALFLMAYGNARVQSGFDIIANLIDFLEMMNAADIVITGEGSIDDQTKYGKVVSSISHHARRKGKKVIAVAGQVKGDRQELQAALGLSGLYTIEGLARDTDDAMENTSQYLVRIGELIGLGYKT